MGRRWWKILVTAKRRADLLDARRRASGGSGTRLGLWLAAAGILGLCAMSWGGWGRQAGIGAVVVIALLAWRDKARDEKQWASCEKALENERKAWSAARLAEARLEASRIESKAGEPNAPSKGPRRL